MNSANKHASSISRRSFNASVAAALISTPFAFAAAQENRRNDDCKYVSPLLTQPCPSPAGPQTEPHEPPIGFDNGSLVVECVEKMHREGSVATAPRKHLYDFESYSYGHMTRLEVITEYDFYYTYDCYQLKDTPRIEAPKLKIWLQRLKEPVSEGEYPWMEEDILPNKEPHVLLRYQPLEQFPSFEGAVIESDKRFGDVKKGYKSQQTFKHNHKGYGRTFRIGRWMLVNGDRSATPLAGDCAGIKYIRNKETNKDRRLELLGFHLRPRFDHLGQLLRDFKARQQRP